MADMVESRRPESVTSDSVIVILSTVFTGSISYFVFFVGTRTLDASSMSEFITLWAVVNTVLLTLTVPADTYAPRLRLECRRADVDDDSRLLVLSTYTTVGGLVTTFVVLGGFVLGMFVADVGSVLAIAAFALASASFASRRAYLTSNGSFRRYLLQTVVLSVVGIAGLAVVLGTGASNQAWLYAPLALANIVAAIVVSPRGARHARHRFKRLATLWPFTRSIDAPRTMARLVVATMIAVILSNGTLIMARFIGAAPTVVVAYAAAINLVLVPFTLINSFTGPIHNRFVRSISEGDFVQVQSDYFSAGSRYLVAVGALSLASYFGLRVVIDWYVGGSYLLPAAACFGIALSEGLATVTALPRALLTALGESRLITPIWIAGLVVFAVTLFVRSLDPLARLVLAPGLAALVILIASTAMIHLTLTERIRVSKRPTPHMDPPR